MDWLAIDHFCQGDLGLLGFKFLSSRAVDTAAEQEEIQNLFTDPYSDVEVLLASLRTASTSLNLRRCRSDGIFLDVPSSFTDTMQASGRVYRIGWTHFITGYFITANHTYNQVLQARAAIKTISMSAGTMDHEAAGIKDL